MIIPIRVTEPQGKIITCKKRFRVVNAGRRFGKSFLAGYEMEMMALNKPGAVVWYVAPTLPTARKVMWNGWIKARDPGTNRPHIPQEFIKKSNEQMMTIEFKNGSMLYLLSATDPDNLRGSGVDLVVFDEAAFMPNGTWEVIRPTLSDKYHEGKALFISTPSGYNWFYDMYIRCQDEKYRDSWESFQFTTIEGGNVTPEEIEEAKRTMSAKMFAQEYLASFETMSNRIYYNFDRDLNSCDMQDWYGAEKTDVHVGIDFNVNPMTATFWAMDKNRKHEDIAVCFDEICEPNSDTQELADMIKTRYPGRQIICYPDPTCRKRQTNAVGGVSDMDILMKNGFEVYVPHAPYATKDKFNCVNTGLCDAAGNRHLFIVKDKCLHLRKAWEGYTYKESEGSSQPDKSGGLDHISDAAAYFINYAFPMRARGVSRPNVQGV